MKRPNYQFALAAAIASGVFLPAHAETQTSPPATRTPTEFADDKQRAEKSQSQSTAFQSQLDASSWQQRRFISSPNCPLPTAEPLKIEEKTPDTQRAPTHVLADSVNATGNQKLQLKGNVEVSNPQMKLAAGSITLDRQHSAFDANERILLETPSALFSAEQAKGRLQQGTAELNQTRFRIRQSGANGSAERLAIDANQSMDLTNLTFSTCPEGDNSWRFSAASLTIDSESGWGEADDMVLRVGGVPIFYFPWLTFPVDDRRKSGLLPPTISDSTRNGFEYSQPIYWNIAPNYDATITPRYLERRGTQLGMEFRYLQGDNLESRHYGESQIQLLDDRLAENSEQQRWSYQLLHQSRFAEYWRIDVKAAGVSDPWYFQDLGNDFANSNLDRLTRFGQVGYFAQELQAGVSLLQFQPLAIATEPYRELPRFHLFWQPLDAANPWQWTLSAEHTQFRSDDPTQVEADRSVLQSRLQYDWSSAWGFLKPAIKWHHASYHYLDDSRSADSLDIPSYSIDSGLIFERALGSGTQTLEPRLFVLYTPYQDQSSVAVFDTREPDFSFDQLFRDNRYLGPDRIGDEKRASIAITSRFFDAEGNQSVKLSLGRSYYSEPPRVTLQSGTVNDSRTSSDPVAQFVWHPDNNLRLSADLAYNQQRDETSQGRLSLMYEPKDNFIVNVSHRFKDTGAGFLEQSDLAFALPLSERWRVMGRWQYDLVQKQSLETFAGLEYESCCWAVRIFAKRYLSARLDVNGGIIPDQSGRFNSDVYLQFIFKGMGGAGQKSLSRQLEDSIWSYQDLLY